MKGKIYLLTLLLCLATGVAVVAEPPGAQKEEQANVIKAVDVEEREDGTYITLKGSARATYSVFKLNRPLRLFVDISNSRLDGSLRRGPIQVGNGVIGQVAVLEFSDDVQQIARMIINFDTPAGYDVRSEGDNVVVVIDGTGRGKSQPVAGADADSERRRQDLDRARRALAEKERRLADTEEKVASLERALREAQGDEESSKALQRTLDSERAKASSLRDELSAREARLASLEEAVNTERERVRELEDTVANMKDEQQRLAKEVEDAQARARSLAKERDAARKESDSLSAKARKDSDRLQTLERDLDKARKDLERAEAARASAQRDADRLNGELGQLQTQLATQDKEAAALRAQVKDLDAQRNAARTVARNGDEAAAKRLKELEAQYNSKASELAGMEKRLKSVSGQITSKERELAGIEKRSRDLEASAQAARDRSNKTDAQRREQAALAEKSQRDRLEALEKSREAEQQRLKELEKARQKEEARVASLKKEAEALERRAASNNAPRGGASADTRLTTVKENGDAAEVTLKDNAASAVVQTGNAVKAVRFQQKGDISRIIIELDRPGNFETVPWKGGKASLLLNDAELPNNLERTLDTQAFGGTVRYVSSYRADDGTVHVVAHVPTATTEIVRQNGAQLVWEFSSVGAGEGVGSPEHADAAAPAAPAGHTAAPPNFRAGSRRATINNQTPPWQRRPSRMARKRLSLDLRGADIANVLRMIAIEGGVSIVAGDKVKGTVTMRLDNVLLADAFVTILKSLSLGYEQDGNIIRVAPAKTFEDAAKRRRDEIVASFPLEPLEVVLMPINYGDAEAIATLIETVLSSRGSVVVDTRTNTLVIKDVAQNLGAAQQLVLSLDTQTPQILIEARIVETNDTFSRQIGVQWGGDFLASPANGNPTGLTFPSVVGVAGAATDGQTPLGGIVGTPNFAVNLPAAVGAGQGGGIGLTLGSLGGAGNLALRLTALENEGHIKIVSAPRVLTMDNVSATISSGTSIPISVVSAAGVQTVFVEANLELQVTPHVTQDGNVSLELIIDKSEPDFANTGAAGDPSIIRRRAQTTLLVNDGDTTVIGGIFAHTSATGSNKVPFLADIPILGFFFRDFSEDENRSELLIFVTPRIVNREAALDSRRLNPIDAPDVASGAGGGN
mgnify:CR=1 FL=1